jgi:hypothetical protein
MQYLKTTIIQRSELNKWKKYFSIYGAKSEFERETEVTRQTLHNILKNGRGDERTVSAVRNFYQSKITKAVA